jgi:hypothetical protein
MSMRAAPAVALRTASSAHGTDRDGWVIFRSVTIGNATGIRTAYTRQVAVDGERIGGSSTGVLAALLILAAVVASGLAFGGLTGSFLTGWLALSLLGLRAHGVLRIIEARRRGATERPPAR